MSLSRTAGSPRVPEDGILIKDNHIAVAGGLQVAVERARRAVGHMVKIEVEADMLEQAAEHCFGATPG